jgi:hypothetical protein
MRAIASNVYLLEIPLPFRLNVVDLPVMERWMAFYETLAHLVNMEREKLVQRENGGFTTLFQRSEGGGPTAQVRTQSKGASIN